MFLTSKVYIVRKIFYTPSRENIPLFCGLCPHIQQFPSLLTAKSAGKPRLPYQRAGLRLVLLTNFLPGPRTQKRRDISKFQKYRVFRLILFLLSLTSPP